MTSSLDGFSLKTSLSPSPPLHTHTHTERAYWHSGNNYKQLTFVESHLDFFVKTCKTCFSCMLCIWWWGRTCLGEELDCQTLAFPENRQVCNNVHFPISTHPPWWEIFSCPRYPDAETAAKIERSLPESKKIKSDKSRKQHKETAESL